MQGMDFIKACGADLAGRWLPGRKRLAGLRARWGQPGEREGFLASRYFDLTRRRADGHHVDDKTWNDLEFPRLFARMNTAASALGSQVLYRQLRTRVDDPAVLASRHATYQMLRGDHLLRERIQMCLMRLDDEGSSRMSTYLFGDMPENGQRFRLLQAWAVLSLAIIVATIPLSLPAWLFVSVLAVNFVITLANMGEVNTKMDVFTCCLRMVGAAERLSAMRVAYPALPQLQALAREKPRHKDVKRALRGFRLMLGLSATHVPIAAELANMVKALLLIEVLVCNHALKRFVRVRDKLADTFELIGELDAAIAVASWLEHVGMHCRPEWVDDARMALVDGVHPLLADGVPNSIRPGNQSVLVTGSNMAGKTTFIKMVGLNMLLGRTLGVCTAKAAIVPRGLVMASIHNHHSVASGKSRYFAEIEAIKLFLRQASTPGSHVFLLDEPFSGTNTRERIAIACAVLEALDCKARVFVTTHDVELQALLGARYMLCHFQENPGVEGFFDYRLRPGSSHEHNAIGLLERVGFPSEVVERARSHADALSG